MNNFEQTQSHMIYLYTPRSHSTREMYLRRLRRFFDAINIEGSTFGARCNLFAKREERIHLGLSTVFYDLCSLRKIESIERKLLVVHSAIV